MAALAALAAATLLVSVPGSADRAVSRADLAAMPAITAEARFHGGTHRCTGPRLGIVLKAAGAPTEGLLRGDVLRMGVMAEAADGYRVLFALGELDPMLGNADVIVALTCAPQPTDAQPDDGHGTGAPDALRLLAGGDTRGARSVRNLVALRLIQLP